MSPGLDVAEIRGYNVHTDIGLVYSSESVYVCLSAVFARVL